MDESYRIMTKQWWTKGKPVRTISIMATPLIGRKKTSNIMQKVKDDT